MLFTARQRPRRALQISAAEITPVSAMNGKADIFPAPQLFKSLGDPAFSASQAR